jgi:hypothetical protein
VMLPQRVTGNDFAHTYLSSRLMLEGRDVYGTPLGQVYTQYGFANDPDIVRATNPPTMVLLLMPLAMLPARVAFWIWVVVQVGSVAAILWLTWKLLCERLSRRGWGWVCVVALASETVYAHFFFSQVQLPLAALILAAYRWQRAGRHGLACGAIMLAGLVKLVPFVLLPWFVWQSFRRQRERVVWGFALAGAAGAVAFAAGLNHWSGFFHNSFPVIEHCAIGHLVFTGPVGLMNFGAALIPVNASQLWDTGVMVGIGLLGATYWRSRGAVDGEAEFCLLCVAMLAAGITTRGYYFVLLIFPMTVAAVRVLATPSRGRMFGLLMLGSLLNDLNGWAPSILDENSLGRLVFQYAPLYGLLGLGLFFWKEIGKETP